MLWKIFMLILTAFFLTSVWADDNRWESPIDIDSEKVTSDDSPLPAVEFINPDEQLEFYTEINKTGDQIVKIKLKGGGKPPAVPWLIGNYSFEEIQFYMPSEHRIDHKSFDLEIIIVFYYENGFKTFENAIGKESGVLIVSQLYKCVDGDKGDIDDVFKSLEDGKKFKMNYLNVNYDEYYFYSGSFLRPPYTENVSWMINTIPKTITCKQRDHFKEIREKLLDGHPDLGPQTRETQPINEREIYKFESE